MHLKPAFITFEGIEGSGKSTHLRRLLTVLETQGVTAIVTREPGGTPVGNQLRAILLDPKTQLSNLYTELTLFTADRLEHISAVIEPALSAGRIVFCDRYIDSTYAYQLGGRQLDPKMVNVMMGLASLQPDLTVLFDVDPEVGLSRAKGRAELDRFEHEELAFHIRVREAYLELHRRFPDRIKLVNTTSSSVEETSQHVQRIVLEFLKKESKT